MKIIIFFFLLIALPLYGGWECLQYEWSNNGFIGASVWNEQYAWLCGLQDAFGGVVWRTTDGGNNWTQNSPSSNTFFLHSIQFLDANFGVVTGCSLAVIFPVGAIYYTNNGGVSWTPASVSGITFLRIFMGLHFPDSQHGYAVATGGRIYITNNGGLDWNEQELPDTTHPYEQVFFLDSLTGWVVGGTSDTITYIAEKGVIVKTTDGGNSWTTQLEDYPLDIANIYFTDADNGWAVAYKDTSSPGYFLHTTNGGIDWTEIPGPNATLGRYALYDIEFLDSQEAWAVGGGDLSGWQNNHFAVFLHTTNGGSDWQLEELYPGSLPGTAPLTFDMYNNTFGIAAGTHLGIFRYSEVDIREVKDLRHKTTDIRLLCHPNPFTTVTTISFNLPRVSDYQNTRESDVELNIYDASGRLVKSFSLFTPHSSFIYSVSWDGKDNYGKILSTGIYYITLEADNTRFQKKIILMR